MAIINSSQLPVSPKRIDLTGLYYRRLSSNSQDCSITVSDKYNLTEAKIITKLDVCAREELQRLGFSANVLNGVHGSITLNEYIPKKVEESAA